MGRHLAVSGGVRRADRRRQAASVFPVERKPAPVPIVEQDAAGDAPVLFVIRRREVCRRSEARREQLSFATLVERDHVCNREIGPAVPFQRLNVVKSLLRQSSEHVVDVLMEERQAYLGVVNEVVCVLLPDPEAEIAGPDRYVAAELELRIALRFQVELRQRRLQGKIEKVRGLRANVLKGEWLEEAADVGIEARAFTEEARELEPRAEGAEALRKLGRLDVEEIVTKSVVRFPKAAHTPAVLKVRLVGIAGVWSVVDDRRRRVRRARGLDGGEKVVWLQRDRVVLQYASEVVRYAGCDGVLPERLHVVALHDVIECRPLVRKRIAARRWTEVPVWIASAQSVGVPPFP